MDSLGYPPCVDKYAAERASRINKAQSVDFFARTTLPLAAVRTARVPVFKENVFA
jgi:hypothetical protein